VTYNNFAFSAPRWDDTKYRGFFWASTVAPVSIGTRPLPIFTFTGDDICIVYSPTYKARETRTKLFGSVGQAMRYVPPFVGGENHAEDGANIDLKVLADGNALGMFPAGRFAQDDLNGYFRDDGRARPDLGEDVFQPDNPMWWMAPAGGFLRCTVKGTSHHAIVKFEHPYRHEATHQNSKPVELSPGSTSTDVVVEIIRVTPEDSNFLANYSYYAMTQEEYAALDAASDAAAAEAALSALTPLSSLRDYAMEMGAGSGLVHLGFSAMNEGSRLGLVPTLVDYLELEDLQTGLIFTGEEDPAGTQYGGVWHDFPWLAHRDNWQDAPSNPHTSVLISTSIDVMDNDGQVIKVADNGLGYNGYGGPYLCPVADMGLHGISELVLSELEAADVTATIFRPAVSFTLYQLS